MTTLSPPYTLINEKTPPGSILERPATSFRSISRYVTPSSMLSNLLTNQLDGKLIHREDIELTDQIRLHLHQPINYTECLEQARKRTDIRGGIYCPGLFDCQIFAYNCARSRNYTPSEIVSMCTIAGFVLAYFLGMQSSIKFIRDTSTLLST